jgi:hypothetical protein
MDYREINNPLSKDYILLIDLQQLLNSARCSGKRNAPAVQFAREGFLKNG